MKPCPPDLWAALAQADPSATFFQTPAWHALASEFEGTHTQAWLFEFDGAQAVLPVQERRRPWGVLATSPFGGYAAPLATPSFTAEHFEQLRRALSARHLELPGSPFCPAFGAPDGPVSHTRLLHLEGFCDEAWKASWSRNHRRLLEASRKAGHVVRLAHDLADVARYHAIYREQTERWGSATRRTYPEALFRRAFERHAPSGALKLWLAEEDGVVVAGRLCLYHNGHAVEWHAASQREAMQRGVNHRLVHDIVIDAAHDRARVYDFNPNPGLDAVDHFKRGFATEPMAFTGVRRRAGLVGALVALRHRLRARGGAA